MRLVEFVELVGVMLAYGGIGTGTALLNYRNIMARDGATNSDDRMGCFFVGALWPIGIFAAVFGMVTAPRIVTPSSGMTKAQQERERRLVEEREDLRLDVFEAQNREMYRKVHNEIEG